MAELKTVTATETTTAAPSAPANATPNATSKKKSPGLAFRRFFTKPTVSPYDEVEWDLRLAQITDAQGNIIFEQKDVEVPKDWSMTATNIVASKYLARQDRHSRARKRSPPARRPRRRNHPRLGYGPRLLPHRPKTAPRSTTNSSTSSSASTPPSTAPSGSTSAATASSPTPTAATGTGTRKPKTSNSASPDTASPSAPPASSTP